MGFSLPIPDISGGLTLSYDSLDKKYNSFALPQASILLGGKLLSAKDVSLIIGDIKIELTSGFEASVASFKIFNCFNAKENTFQYDLIEKLVYLGAACEIKLGYTGTHETVFVGFVSGIEFAFEAGEAPYIAVNAMDIKGVMMSGSYCKQLLAKNFGDAVKEIFAKADYQKLVTAGAVSTTKVSDTPDKQVGGGGKETAYTIEMTAESDYEFIVKAAKKFNFEFFTEKGTVYFRKAKENKTSLINLEIGKGVASFNVSYSMTGIVQNIEARASDAGTGKIITAKGKYEGDLGSSKAKGIVGKSQRIYIDPTILDTKQAEARVESIVEEMSYRMGSFDCEFVGVPELVPGRFIDFSGLSGPADNTFYVTDVTHIMNDREGYILQIKGKAQGLKKKSIGGSPF